MASNFVPMLSSSPPPLDDCPEEDDDEFGNFASANIPFDSSFDSPVSSEKHKPYKSGDNGVNDMGLNSDFNRFCSFSNSDISPLKNHLNEISHKKQINNTHTIKHENDSIEECLCTDSSNNCNNKHVFVEQCELSIDSRKFPNSVLHDPCNLDSSSSSIDCLDRKQLQESTICSNDKNAIQDKTDLDIVIGELDEEDNYSSGSISASAIEIENDIPSCEITTNHQSIDLNPHGLFNSNNAIDCDTKSIGDRGSPTSSDYVRENAFASEDLEFPVDFATAENHFDDFDDFQQAVQEQNQPVEVESNAVSKLNLTQSNMDEEFDTDFNHFQESENCDVGDSDEFDDFQSFDKAGNICCVKSALENCDESKNLSACEDSQSLKKYEPTQVESEDFDDFQSCSVAEASGTQDFANFDAGSFDGKVRSESSEFADFESASFSSMSDETPPNFACTSSAPVQDKNVDKITTVLNAIFPPVTESCDDYCDQPSEILEQSNKSRRLWEKLHEVEQTPGLRFQWGVSHSFQQLLRSVNVDYHSILRTSSVPIFASSLSLLEPVKGQTNAANAESEDINQSPRVNDPIPPVEFDWTSSGLVNPLDSGVAASALMDLSFLTTNDTATSSSTSDHSFENELLKPSPVPACSENNNKTLILEKLLSKNVCSLPNSKTAHRPSNISQEANSVLDQLPDLSFMRARVLMFPISSKT